MNQKASSNLDLALSDVEFIRKALEERTPTKPDRAEFSITALIFAAALMMLIVEYFVYPNVTSDILTSSQNSELRNTILLESASMLLLLGVGVYLLAWVRSRELQSTLSRVLNRNLEFLRVQTFLPDLALKAFVLAVAISVAAKFVPALLTAFVADYALQGRFFRAGTKVRIAFGLLTYAIAIAMFANEQISIEIPLGIIALITFISMTSIVISRKN